MTIENLQETIALNHTITLTGTFPTSTVVSGLPMGTIRTYSFDFLPDASGDANGSVLAIAQNPALFSLLGTSHGGDGATTFALPDLEDRLMVGQGAGPGLPNRVAGQEFGVDLLPVSLNNLPVEFGGSGVALDNHQASTTLVYAINVAGNFPTPTSGPTGHGFLGQVAAFAYSADFLLPDNWVAAEGQILSIASNTALFAIIGDTYGGDGRTTFALPDLRGRVPVHPGEDIALGEKTSSTEFDLSSATIPVSQGGSGQAVDNMQPSLGINHLVATSGIFPDTDTAPSETQPFLGEIEMFAGTFAPSGFAFANGQSLSPGANQALFSVIGTVFGGDGISDFALPDLRDRAVVDTSNDRAIGTVEGENFTTLDESDLADILDVQSLIVTTADDVVDMNDGLISLREAIELAQSTADADGDGESNDTITFADALGTATITLGSGLQTLTTDVTIDGGGDITIDGSGSFRPFDITAGTVRLQDLTITNGFADDGGAVRIRNDGTTVTISGSTITGNRATSVGGGVDIGGSATASIIDSTIHGNSATNAGGGVNVSTATATVINSTIDGNAAGFGGGVRNVGFTNIVNSTIANNAADTSGGIFNARALTVANTTITGNFATSGAAGGIGSQSALVLSNTLIAGNRGSGPSNDNLADFNGSSSDLGGNLFGGDVNQIFATLVEIDPDGLAGTGDEFMAGGLTANPNGPDTAALLSGGLAIDAGDNSLLPPDTTDIDGDGDTTEALPLDALGNERTRGLGLIVDIGAVEFDPDTITGTQGQDTLTGGGLPNTILGLGDDDLLIGGGGADSFDGGDGNDTVSYADSAAAVTVSISSSFPIATGGDAEGDTFANVENLTGSDHDDFLAGDTSGNRLEGLLGDDFLSGDAGNDTLIGGEGGDVLEGGTGGDTIDGGADLDILGAFGASGPITIDLGNMANSSADFAGDTLISVEGVLGSSVFSNTLIGSSADDLLIGGNAADEITGDQGADILLGQGEADSISGEAGADVILGGLGNDTISGGADDDVFLFALNDPAGEGVDLITDFSVSDGDLILFYGTGFPAGTVTIGTAGSGDALLSYGTASSVEIGGVTEAEVNLDTSSYFLVV